VEEYRPLPSQLECSTERAAALEGVAAAALPPLDRATVAAAGAADAPPMEVRRGLGAAAGSYWLSAMPPATALSIAFLKELMA